MDRRAFIVALFAVYGCGQREEPKKAVEAPKSAPLEREKIARLGFLAGFSRLMTQGAASMTIVERLRELGYVEGRNLVIDYRHAETEEPLRELAGQLVATGNQVIYAQGPYALRAARAATATISIVGLDHESDPVAAGYAASLARPGGNVTGVFLDQSEISAKQLQLLRELVPGLTRVAVLFDAEVASAQRESVEGAARRLGVTIAPIVWYGPDALPAALQSATQDGARGLIVLSSPHIYEQGNRRRVVDAALKRRLPAITLLSSWARDGLLVTYGPVQNDMYRSAANLVAKILDGAPPAGLPIERPVRYELVINLSTAKALGLTIPQSFVSRADEVVQ
jgi:putative tryptophan/tyrosine transport system substrate-binding protein